MLNELLLGIIGSLAYSFYKWVTLNNDYFEKRNIKYMKPKFLVGNIAELYSDNTVIELASIFPNEL